MSYTGPDEESAEVAEERIDEGAELAEELIEAEAAGAELDEIEDRLDTVDAEEDAAEVVARAGVVGGFGDAEGTETPSPTTPEERRAADEPDSLDDIVRGRVEEQLGTEPPDLGERRGELRPPPAPDEFVCRSCGLTRRRTQLADPIRGLCVDCAADMPAGA